MVRNYDRSKLCALTDILDNDINEFGSKLKKEYMSLLAKQLQLESLYNEIENQMDLIEEDIDKMLEQIEIIKKL